MVRGCHAGDGFELAVHVGACHAHLGRDEIVIQSPRFKAFVDGLGESGDELSVRIGDLLD